MDPPYHLRRLLASHDPMKAWGPSMLEGPGLMDRGREIFFWGHLMFQLHGTFQQSTLSKTNIVPENGWLEDDISYWEGLFSGDMLVSERVKYIESIKQCFRFFGFEFQVSHNCTSSWVEGWLVEVIPDISASDPVDRYSNRCNQALFP